MTRLAQPAARVLTVAAFGVLPVFVIGYVFWSVAGAQRVTDFHNTFYGAAQAVLRGDSPYPALDDPVVAEGMAFVYPPLTAIAAVPFTAVSVDAAGYIVMALLLAAVAGTLALVGVRDWRCYGIAFLWPPVIAAVQTGNITIPLALGAAFVWRSRDRGSIAGPVLGITLAAKLILWPLLFWLGATRRLFAALVALVVGGSILLASWAVIGFAGLGDYPDLLRRLQELEEAQGYTVYALAIDLGTSAEIARSIGAALAAALLGGVLILARRRDERRAFVLAVAAVLACSPIVWLHYFAILIVLVAVAQPTLGPVWFAPLAMYLATGTHNGTTFQTALTIAAAAVTVGLACFTSDATRRPDLRAARVLQPEGFP